MGTFISASAASHRAAREREASLKSEGVFLLRTVRVSASNCYAKKTVSVSESYSECFSVVQRVFCVVDRLPKNECRRGQGRGGGGGGGGSRGTDEVTPKPDHHE